MAAKFEISSSKPGEFNWVLKSQGRILAIGSSYPRKVSAEKAIESLRKAAASGTVADLTLRPAKTAPAKAAANTTKRTSRRPARPGGEALTKKAGRRAAGTAKRAAAGKRTSRRR